MLKIAVLVFAIGAVGGLILANSVLRGRMASWALSVVHMLIGATGLVLTGIVVLGGGNTASVVAIALLLLVVAALGGFLLASYHARKALPPKAIVLVHAGAAVIGFLLLVGGAFELA